MQKIKKMKKLLIIAAMALLAFGFESCQKNKYCQCYATVDGESVPLGEDPPTDLGNLTASEIEDLDPKYNVYIIESGTCNDKAKEISGWGQVTCQEVDPKSDGNWFTNLFGGNNNNNNNNNH